MAAFSFERYMLFEKQGSGYAKLLQDVTRYVLRLQVSGTINVDIDVDVDGMIDEKGKRMRVASATSVVCFWMRLQLRRGKGEIKRREAGLLI